MGDKGVLALIKNCVHTPSLKVLHLNNVGLESPSVVEALVRVVDQLEITTLSVGDNQYTQDVLSSVWFPWLAENKTVRSVSFSYRAFIENKYDTPCHNLLTPPAVYELYMLLARNKTLKEFFLSPSGAMPYLWQDTSKYLYENLDGFIKYALGQNKTITSGHIPIVFVDDCIADDCIADNCIANDYDYMFMCSQAFSMMCKRNKTLEDAIV